MWRHVGGGVSYNEEDVVGVGSRGTYVFRARTSRARHAAAVKRVVRPPGRQGGAWLSWWSARWSCLRL